jgi:hypothetical protein
MQDRKQEHRDRPTEVDQFPEPGIDKDVFGAAQISFDDSGGAPIRQQRTGVRDYCRVVVDVHGAGVGRDGVDDLVHVALRRQARADVDELPDTRLGDEKADDPLEEGSVAPGRLPDSRPVLLDLLGCGTVCREVLPAAQQVVVDAGDVSVG